MPGTSEYISYSRRWAMLSIYFLILAQNSSQWICLSPMVDTVARYYSCEHFWIYCSILIFDLLSPFSFPAGILVSRFGCQRAILAAALGTCIGGWIKATWLSATGQLFGQVIMAFAHVFGAVSVPVFSATWFPTSQRALSTSILFLATILGGGAGFLLGPSITQSNPARLPLFLCTHAAVGTLLCAPVLLLQKKPPTPPSRSAEVAEHHMPSIFSSDLDRALANPQFLLLLGGFSLSFSILNTVAITVNDIFSSFGYSDLQVGVIGCGTVSCGMLGCIIHSIVVERFDWHHRSLVFTNTTTGISMLLLFLNMKPDNFFHIFFVVCVASFFGIASFPVAYEMACEVLFPIHEAIAGCILTVFGQWLSICMTAIEYYTIQNKANVPLFAAVLYIIVIIIFYFFSGDLKRRQLDKGCGLLQNSYPQMASYSGLGVSEVCPMAGKPTCNEGI